MKKLLFLSFTLALILTIPAMGSEPDKNTKKKTIKVAVTEFKPVVIKKEDNTFTGFEIELFEAAAQIMGLQYEYRETDFNHRFNLLRNKEVDIVISGSTITAERESSGIDFSHRDLASGLQIMIRKESGHSTTAILKSALDPSVIKIFLVLVAFCALMGQFFIFFENFRVEPKPFPANFIKNAVTGTYWALVTASTVGYGDVTPKTYVGKLVSKVTILGGIAIFGLYIGAVSSINMSKQLESKINSPTDLAGKQVATVADTTSVITLKDLGANVKTTTTIDESFKLLTEDKVDAVVFDSPSLKYFAQRDGAGTVSLVGPVFDKQDYGIAFQEGSPLREDFNRALLTLHKNGLYDNLYKKYFGE